MFNLLKLKIIPNEPSPFGVNSSNNTEKSKSRLKQNYVARLQYSGTKKQKKCKDNFFLFTLTTSVLADSIHELIV